MRDLSLHILDIAENSIRAGATRVAIRLLADSTADLLRLEITDNGAGMDEDLCRRALSAFATTRVERRIGLGLALLSQAAAQADGRCTLESQPGQGTHLVATFRRSHIDCKPLGHLDETILALAVGNPEVDFVVEVGRDGVTHSFDTQQICAELGGTRSSAEGIRLLQSRLRAFMAQASNFPADHTPAQQIERKGAQSCGSNS